MFSIESVMFLIVSSVLTREAYAIPMVSVLKQENCGFAPLCSSPEGTFNFLEDFEPDFNIPALSTAKLVGGNVIEFSDCCLAKDTQPTNLCEAVNPSGVHERSFTASERLCDLTNSCGEIDDRCEDSEIVLRPAFIKTETEIGSACCASCSCYGESLCQSFEGVKETWVLCDGREIQDDPEEQCPFTKNQCLTQKDHAGNSCVFLAENENGDHWSSIQKGSPCVPNPDSPPSLIKMYDVSLPLGDGNLFTVFALNVEQGERGTINQVYFTLSVGLFSMTSLDCLTKEGSEAWSFSADGFDFGSIFTSEVVVERKDVLWTILDPFTGVSVQLRCFSNTYNRETMEGEADYIPEGGVYVPRMNIESLVDPFMDSRASDTIGGFCVSGELDFGRATTNHSDFILEEGLCTEGSENQENLDVVRAICKSPSMPLSHKHACLSSFCSKNFLPLFDSPEDCLEVITDEDEMAEGFCMGVVFSELDVYECLDQWIVEGPIATIDQYYSNREGCFGAQSLQATGGRCQSGVSLQAFDNETQTWQDVLFIPGEFCGDEDILLSKCDYPELFDSNIRFFQRNPGPSCSASNACESIAGFVSFIGLVTPTTSAPTMYPTVQPSTSPTRFPTTTPTFFPTTNSPTGFPTTAMPTDFPTYSPTESPSTVPPTNFPSRAPTTNIPTYSPTQSPSTTPPTNFPSRAPTTNPIFDIIPPAASCEYRLCETPELYISLSNEENTGGSFRSFMDSCCPQPIEANCDEDEFVVRAQGSSSAFCGIISGNLSETEPLKETCEFTDSLQISISFFKDEETECCRTCKCYGDPICESFSGAREEFVLCDGRTPQESFDDRCIIRKNTCESQTDHEGNACRWHNPNVAVPVKSTPSKQAKAEKQFSVAKYGSPCRFDDEVSSESVVLLYSVPGLEINVAQGERGYIKKVFISTNAGTSQIDADGCLEGDQWAMDELDGRLKFSVSSFGEEKFWKVVNNETGVEVGVRCTGNLYSGKLTEPYMNIEYLREPSDFVYSPDAADGFCVTNEMPEKNLASTEHTSNLTESGACSSWKFTDRSDIILRNSMRVIMDKPGLSNYGKAAAVEEFCSFHARPTFKSVSDCEKEFNSVKDASDIISAFCKAVSFDPAPCVEALEIYAEIDGYEVAFENGKAQYTDGLKSQCNIDDLPELLENQQDQCKLGVQLQYLSEFGWANVEWIPAEMSKCNGYVLNFNFGENEKYNKLFQFPIRVLQTYEESSDCGVCEYISGVEAAFEFSSGN